MTRSTRLLWLFFFFFLTKTLLCVTPVDGVCTVTSYVGRELAPHVKKHGGKLIPESMKKDKDGRSNIDGAMVVAASGVQGKMHLLFLSSGALT